MDPSSILVVIKKIPNSAFKKTKIMTEKFIIFSQFKNSKCNVFYLLLKLSYLALLAINPIFSTKNLLLTTSAKRKIKKYGEKSQEKSAPFLRI